MEAYDLLYISGTGEHLSYPSEIRQRGYKLGRVKIRSEIYPEPSLQKNRTNRNVRFIDNQTLQLQRGEKKLTLKSAVFIVTADNITGNFINNSLPCVPVGGAENKAITIKTGSILIIGSGRLVAELATYYANFNRRIWIATSGDRLIAEMNRKMNTELNAALKMMNIEVIPELKIDSLQNAESPEIITFSDNKRNYWRFLISLNSYNV